MLRYLGLLLLLAPSSAAATQVVETPLGAWSDWTAIVYDGLTTARVCAASPQRLDAPDSAGAQGGGVHWAYNAARRNELPGGYLSIGPAFADGMTAGTVVVDGYARFSLDLGEDGYAYGEPAQAGELFAALRRGRRAEVTLTGSNGNDRLELSLIGFTAATEASRRACGF